MYLVFCQHCGTQYRAQVHTAWPDQQVVDRLINAPNVQHNSHVEDCPYCRRTLERGWKQAAVILGEAFRRAWWQIRYPTRKKKEAKSC